MVIPEDIWLLLSEYLRWEDYAPLPNDLPREGKVKIIQIFGEYGSEANCYKLGLQLEYRWDRERELSSVEMIEYTKPIWEKIVEWMNQLEDVEIDEVIYGYVGKNSMFLRLALRKRKGLW
ncbi:hypothetical protein DRZ78_03075 [Candidatus Aerophobetes bacterium]|uniref:Uncharacterized protein n=1 Tax=Aerophobetes bacterium TaxID=2030807 RepID=A0A662CZH9_UNCAE|nr:MAG: hypothetical protein DRZ78_03075 [Candidatus Aerophobetes bacterium]